LVENEVEDECVQQSKERGKCACESSKENEEDFESGGRTLRLCFSSFKLLKKNVYNVSNQKSSRHDVDYEESGGLANENHLPLCFSSFEFLKINHGITKEDDKIIVVQIHFPCPEIDEDIQQDPQEKKGFEVVFPPLRMMWLLEFQWV
jgi:hypothetical protein